MTAPVPAVPGDQPTAKPIGYVLVDPNTHAMDWDGVLHATKTDAVKELVENVHSGHFKEPFEYGPVVDKCDLAYMICAIVPVPDADDWALRRLQDAHLKAQQDFAEGL